MVDLPFSAPLPESMIMMDAAGNLVATVGAVAGGETPEKVTARVRAEMVCIYATAKRALQEIMPAYHAAFYRSLPPSVVAQLRAFAAEEMARGGATLARQATGTIVNTLCGAIYSLPSAEVGILAALCAALGWNAEDPAMATRDIWKVARANNYQHSEEHRVRLIEVQAILLAALPRLELHYVDLLLVEYHADAAGWVEAIAPWVCLELEWALFRLGHPPSLLTRAIVYRCGT